MIDMVDNIVETNYEAFYGQKYGRHSLSLHSYK